MPGSVMSMASAARAASVGPGAELPQAGAPPSFFSVEALAEGLFGLSGSSLQPTAGDFVEQTLLAAKPAQAEGLDRLGRTECGGIVAGLFLQRSKGFIERGVTELRQIGDCFFGHGETPE